MNVIAWPPRRRPGACSTAAVVLVAVLITSVSGARQASAHAELVGSEPARSVVLADAPTVVRVWFSEPVDRGVSTIQVTTVDREVVADATRADPARQHGLAVDLPEDLSDGVYVVRWRVLSGADGHITGGMLAFGVGAAADPGSVVGEEIGAAASSADAMLRVVWFLGFAALVGALAVTLGPLESSRLRTSATRARRRAQARLLSVAALGAVIGLLVGFGAAVLQQRLLRSTSLGDGGPSVVELVTDTRWGAFWLLRQSGLLVVLALVVRARRDVTATPFELAPARRWSITALVTALGVALAHALGGHAAAVDDAPALAVAADAVHLVTAACWAGGLVALLIVHARLARSADSRSLIWPMWRAFGPLAAVCVGLVAITGVYALGQQTTSLDAVLATGYGRTLLAKTVLFGAMGVLGLSSAAVLHRAVGLRVGRALRRPPGWVPQSGRLRRLITIEAALGLGAVVLAGFASASPPAIGAEFSAPAGTDLSSRSEFTDGMVVSLSVHPNRPGPNVLTVRATSTRRPPPAPVDVALIRVSRGDSGPTETVTLDHLGDGVFEGSSAVLDRSDQWRTEVVLRRTGQSDVEATFDWFVPATRTRSTIVSNRPWEGLLEPLSALLLAAGLLIAVWVWRIARRGRSEETVADEANRRVPMITGTHGR